MIDVVCAGQLVMDCLIRNVDEDTSGRSRRAESVSLHPGGDCHNQSVILSHLGLNVACAGFLGGDDAGKMLAASLRESGCDLSHLSVRTELATPVCAITVNQDGSRRSVNSAAINLAGHLLDGNQLPASRALSLASCFRAPLADPIADQKLAEKARRAGTKVFADAKLPLEKLPGIESYGPFFANVDYFFPNESEAAYYSGVSLDEDCGLPAFEKAADFFRSLGVRNVVIKAGSRGCYLRSEKDSVMFPALAADVIDTTGAGDSFVAGFIRAFLAGKDNRDCCRFALRCAAATVGALGATSGIRDRLVGERLWAEFTAR